MLLIGIMMLFGGGLCVTADAVMMFMAGANNFLIWLGLLALAALISWIGWLLVKAAKAKPSRNAIEVEEIKQVADSETN